MEQLTINFEPTDITLETKVFWREGYRRWDYHGGTLRECFEFHKMNPEKELAEVRECYGAYLDRTNKVDYLGATDEQRKSFAEHRLSDLLSEWFKEESFFIGFDDKWYQDYKEEQKKKTVAPDQDVYYLDNWDNTAKVAKAIDLCRTDEQRRILEEITLKDPHEMLMDELDGDPFTFLGYNKADAEEYLNDRIEEINWGEELDDHDKHCLALYEENKKQLANL